MGLTFEQLRQADVARCESVWHMCDDWTPTDWACAAAGELGEACNLIKKLRRGEEIPLVGIAHELADTVIYLDLLAARLRIDLGEAIREKFNLVSARVGSAITLQEERLL